jgi:nitrogen regulation protein NR(I)
MNSILIVDDDIQLRNSFEKLLANEGYEVRTAATGEEGVAAVKKDPPDLVIMDVRMPGMSGLEAFKMIRDRDPKQTVIVMTAFGTTETAIEATRMGAFDYILKPFDIPDALELIKQALEASRVMKSRVEMDDSPDKANHDAIIGRSEAMQEVYKAIGRVAPTDATVLVRGESGTGKELVARALYNYSRRADRPFLVINCVAIPETLLESELFGYEKGAFTGASGRRTGKIEMADGGTVFLDEIGDMPLNIQSKILRLLQERSIERLGGREPIPVDVRIIAATNRDLETALAEGRFREDLYYRLNVVAIRVPPLRERAEDAPLLCDYYLARYSAEMGIDNPGLTEDARLFAKSHPWHGNVRELANAMKKAIIFSRGLPVRREDISHAVEAEQEDTPDEEQAVSVARQWVRDILKRGKGEDLYESLMDKFGAIVISEALIITGGNRTRAARLLGLTRPTLMAKIDKYNITIEASVRG